ncbi:MAG: hypothetical protein EHM86_09165 [Desulfobulbaceae bacterium]|nr:MAG: hypothetical protein EHM86_09165 [Desulfobulbaceae bacterium]
MKKYQIVTYSNPQDMHFVYKTAAFLASVSTQFLHQCEDEDLITCRIMVHGQKGLCFADVQKLKLIRHLHEDMGMALDEIDFLIRYRCRIKAMQHQLEKMKQQIYDQKSTYEAEIQSLRLRLAQLDDNSQRQD